jgi:hypothetical protein
MIQRQKKILDVLSILYVCLALESVSVAAVDPVLVPYPIREFNSVVRQKLCSEPLAPTYTLFYPHKNKRPPRRYDSRCSTALPRCGGGIQR